MVVVEACLFWCQGLVCMPVDGAVAFQQVRCDLSTCMSKKCLLNTCASTYTH